MIYYRAGYKYQLAKVYTVLVRAKPGHNVSTEFIDLTMNGRLTIKAGYAWDGPSGITFDTPNSMRGSLVHDALYQLIRQGQISKRWRTVADMELYTICRSCGMSKIRAWIWLKAVRRCAAFAADPKNKKPIMEAP